jgi:hypothetical protein
LSIYQNPTTTRDRGYGYMSMGSRTGLCPVDPPLVLLPAFARTGSANSRGERGVFRVEEGVGLLIFRILYGHEADPQILLRRATLRFGSQITRIFFDHDGTKALGRALNLNSTVAFNAKSRTVILARPSRAARFLKGLCSIWGKGFRVCESACGGWSGRNDRPTVYIVTTRNVVTGKLGSQIGRFSPAKLVNL